MLVQILIASFIISIASAMLASTNILSFGINQKIESDGDIEMLRKYLFDNIHCSATVKDTFQTCTQTKKITLFKGPGEAVGKIVDENTNSGLVGSTNINGKFYINAFCEKDGLRISGFIADSTNQPLKNKLNGKYYSFDDLGKDIVVPEDGLCYRQFLGSEEIPSEESMVLPKEYPMAVNFKTNQNGETILWEKTIGTSAGPARVNLQGVIGNDPGMNQGSALIELRIRNKGGTWSSLEMGTHQINVEGLTLPFSRSEVFLAGDSEVEIKIVAIVKSIDPSGNLNLEMSHFNFERSGT